MTSRDLDQVKVVTSKRMSLNTSKSVGDRVFRSQIVTNLIHVVTMSFSEYLYSQEQTLRAALSVCVYCTACPHNTFQCASNGMCIPTCQLCDGFSQCGDYSDERNCSGINSKYIFSLFNYLVRPEISQYITRKPCCCREDHAIAMSL